MVAFAREPLPVPLPLPLDEPREPPLRLDDAVREREPALRLEADEDDAVRERVPLDEDPEEEAERVRERERVDRRRVVVPPR